MPAGTRRDGHLGRVQPHDERQPDRRVRVAGGPGHRERVPRRRPGVRRQRPDSPPRRRRHERQDARRAGLRSRRELPPRHQVGGACGIDGPDTGADAARLLPAPHRQDRAGAARDSRGRLVLRTRRRAGLRTGEIQQGGARPGGRSRGRRGAARGRAAGDTRRPGLPVRGGMGRARGVGGAATGPGADHDAGGRASSPRTIPWLSARPPCRRRSSPYTSSPTRT